MQSFLLRAIANRVLALGLNCCISAATGKLATTYATEFPQCIANTVHTNCFIPVGKTRKICGINWSLADVHALLVDEVRFSS